jgi:hypothetical protein
VIKLRIFNSDLCQSRKPLFFKFVVESKLKADTLGIIVKN